MLSFFVMPARQLVVLAGLLMALPLLPVNAQQRPAASKAPAGPAAAADTVYNTYQVRIRPEYSAGQFALQQYLAGAKLPAEVRDGRIRGLVQINFVVRADGRLTDAFVARGLSAATNAEALRLVQAMPRWRPALLHDQAVAVRYSLQVLFQSPTQAILPGSGPADQSVSYVKEEIFPGFNPEVGYVKEEVINRSEKVYQYVEQMPVFPGGMEVMLSYISQSIRYPAQALREKVEGRVFVAFVVDQEGRVTDPKVKKGIGAGCDEEAVRVIGSLPRFEPGKQNGQRVMVSYIVPVLFSLNPAAAPASEEKIYTYVEQMPTLAGSTGTAGLSAALQQLLQLPPEVQEGYFGGTIVLRFVVQPTGAVTNLKVVRGLCTDCDTAALTAVRALPSFAPGRQNGRAVAVQLTVPVPMYGPGYVFDGGQVAKQASFPGGGPALRQYLTKELKEPKVLKQENLRGAVEVGFVVQDDGRIGAAEIIRPLCRSCDEEALRLVRSMPRWMPARNAADQPVAVRQQVIIPMQTAPIRQRAD